MLEYLKVHSEELLPPINLNSFSIIMCVIIAFKYIVNTILRKFFSPQIPEPENPDELECSYYYHLTLIVLVIPEINWNVFDLSIWTFSYVIVGIMRNVLKRIQIHKNTILDSIIFDNKLIKLLRNSRKLSFIFAAFSFIYIILTNYYFMHSTIKVNQVLLYPTLLLFFDSVLLLLSCDLIRKKLPYYFNNNIDEISPVYYITSLHSFIKSTIKVWHFSYFLRLFYKSTTNIVELFYSPWIISILNQFYLASKKLASSISEYKKFKSLVDKINVYLPKSVPNPSQICSICQQQLLSCRKIEGCGHKFHFKCIFLWIQSKSYPQCPICRSKIIVSNRDRYALNYNQQ